VGAALAFAARDPIRNAIAFASMVLDPPYHVGDRIRVMDFRGGESAVGEVLRVSLSSTVIESDRRTRIIISNTTVGQLRVENLSAADRHRLELVITIPPALSTEALREACELIERDLAQSPHVSATRPQRVWLSGAGETLLLKASAWLRRGANRRQAQRDLILSMRARLQATGSRPIPGRTASGRAQPHGTASSTTS
jgi:small-conductance mechanosensitive channel